MRVFEDGTKRKTKRICALPANTTEEEAREHFSTLGLSVENPLARCSNCQCWNLCYPVFADDLSRATGVRKHQKDKGTAACGTRSRQSELLRRRMDRGRTEPWSWDCMHA